MSSLQVLYGQLKKQHGSANSWWPTSGKFVPLELEIVIGALLTQNTNWRNVEKVLANLIDAGMLTSDNIAEAKLPVLQRLIKPSGFYKQKAARLKDLCMFISDFDGFYKQVTREQLLSLKGIGKETADSILLYACNKPSFVIDAYTKRLLLRNNIISGREKYDEIKEMFETTLPKNVKLYKEFHALIVENEKSRRAI